MYFIDFLIHFIDILLIFDSVKKWFIGLFD